MSQPPELLFITADSGLLDHWRRAFGNTNSVAVPRFTELQRINLNSNATVWVDLSLPDIPEWTAQAWASTLHVVKARIVAASSNPKDNEAIQALDVGCAAYCHAYADKITLTQIQQVVEAGQIWVGPTLMQRLIKTASNAATAQKDRRDAWAGELTQREREVAILAANGASNLAISTKCKISERTVKAHLSSIFDKLNLSDRLQLALRVHGIN